MGAMLLGGAILYGSNELYGKVLMGASLLPLLWDLAADYHVVAPDLPGFGMRILYHDPAPAAPEPGIEATAVDLETLLRTDVPWIPIIYHPQVEGWRSTVKGWKQWSAGYARAWNVTVAK